MRGKLWDFPLQKACPKTPPLADMGPGCVEGGQPFSCLILVSERPLAKVFAKKKKKLKI